MKLLKYSKKIKLFIKEIKKSKKIMTTIITCIILSMSLGVSYAFFTARSTALSQIVTSDNIILSYTNETILRASDMLPITENDITTKATKISFSVSNNGNGSVNLSYDLNIISIDDSLRDPNFKWMLYENDTKISLGTFESSNDTINLINGNNFTGGLTKNYDLYVYILDNDGNQNQMQTAQMTAKVVVKLDDSLDYTINNNGNIKNTKNSVFSKYTIYGNTSIDHEPSIDNPSRIISLGEEWEELGKNYLVNPDNWSNTFTDDSTHYQTKLLNLKTNQKYEITWDFKDNSNTVHYFYLLIDNGYISEVIAYLTPDLSKVGKYIFTPVEGYKYYLWLSTSGSDITRQTDKFSDIQFHEVKENDTYKPLSYIDVETSGKNVLHDATDRAYWSKNIFRIFDSDNRYYLLLNPYIEIGKTYRFSYSLKNNSDIPYYFYFDTNDPTISFSDYLTTNVIYKTSFTFTPKSGYYYLIYPALDSVGRYDNGFKTWLNKFATFQMVEGSTNVPFSNYMTTTTIDLTGHEPLRRIGDVADYIDYSRGKIVRNIGKKKLKDITFTGKLGLTTANVFYASYLYTDNIIESKPIVLLSNSATYTKKDGIISNYLPTIDYQTMSSNKNIYGILTAESTDTLANEIRVSVPESVASTLSDFNTWLNNQDDLYIYYVLLNPIEENITLPSIPTYPDFTKVRVTDNWLSTSFTVKK